MHFWLSPEKNCVELHIIQDWKIWNKILYLKLQRCETWDSHCALHVLLDFLWILCWRLVENLFLVFWEVSFPPLYLFLSCPFPPLTLMLVDQVIDFLCCTLIMILASVMMSWTVHFGVFRLSSAYAVSYYCPEDRHDTVVCICNSSASTISESVQLFWISQLFNQ